MEDICTVTFTDNEGADAPFEAQVHLVRHVGTEATVDGLLWDLADSRGKGPAAGVKLTARAAARLIGGTWNLVTPEGVNLYGGEIVESDKAPRTKDRRTFGAGLGPVSGENRTITGCVQVRNGRLFLNLGMPKLGSTTETGLDWD